MLHTEVQYEGNVAKLSMYDRFGNWREYSFSKRDDEVFRQCYTAIDRITILDAWVIKVCPGFVILRTKDNKPLYSFYGEELEEGQRVHAYEYFANRWFQWVASSKKYRDANCLYVNLDVMDNNTLVRRLQIDPYSGKTKEIKWH